MRKIWIPSLIVILMLLLFTGCSATANPLDTFQEFENSWESKDYDEMYQLTSLEDQQEINAASFSKAYQVFYESLGVEDIAVEMDAESLVEEGASATIPFTLKLNIPEGEISYSSLMLASKTLEGDWTIDWDDSLIWEGFEAGNNVNRSYELPLRGEIYDRNGSPLAHNGYVIQIGIVPGRLGDLREEMISALAETFQISEKYIQDRLSLPWVGSDTFVDITKVPMDRLSDVRALHNINSGVTYREVRERVYPYGSAAAHLIGYMAYPNESEIEERSAIGFTSDDKIGRTGLEHYLNDRLQGTPGLTISIRNADGEITSILFERETVPGENITLNIDADLQQKLYEQMSNEKGMATVMNHQTGEILALVSAPSFDPNEFILGISSSEYNKLANDPARPLNNRFAKLYSPGSAFMPITAAAALESGTADLDFAVDIQGTQWQKDSSWGSYYITRESEVNGAIDMKTAMVYSDAIYFANLALEMGDSTFTNMAENFGIGSAMALLYPVKTSQIAEGDDIREEIQLADSGYGEAQVLVNILTLPKAFTAFANGGQTVEPVLIWDETLFPTKQRAISEETANDIYQLLESSVSLPYSTGYGAHISGKILAGKTGIAKTPAPYDDSTYEELGWFVVLDLDESTPYVTSMMLEDVKEIGGSSYTVSKVKTFIQSYTNR